jgi:plastocyanin
MIGLIACGGSSPAGPSSGTVVVQSSGAVAASGATITITANGVGAGVSISNGQSVTFINNDTRSHDFESDPHPSHTACPSINNVGTLAAGQTKVTFGFAGTGTCGFHDHSDPSNASFKGTITIR